MPQHRASAEGTGSSGVLDLYQNEQLQKLKNSINLSKR
jgi:hypothetical protein